MSTTGCRRSPAKRPASAPTDCTTSRTTARSPAPRRGRVNARSPTIIEGAGPSENVDFRLNQLRAELFRATNPHDVDVLGERIGRLTGKVALVRVGAATPAELKEKRHRVEDALSATRAAVAEG